MNNNIVDRIKAFMQYKSLNSLSLSKELGYNSSEKISRLFRDKKAKPSYDIIYDISNKFEINVDWLITGRGSMLKDEQKHENTVTPNTTDATYVYNMYDYHSIIIFILWSGHLFAQKNLIYAMSSAFFGQFLHGSWSLLLGIPAVFLIEQV